MSLEFKATFEENKWINYLDMTIIRNANNLTIEMYRKPTNMDTTIYFTSNHRMEQKVVAY
jgi:hypothetical protein